MIYTIQILEDQSLMDVAVQECGSLEAMFDIMKANPDKISHLNATIPANTELTINDEWIQNKIVINSYKKTGVKVVNGAEQLGGIGYMEVEVDFIVS